MATVIAAGKMAVFGSQQNPRIPRKAVEWIRKMRRSFPVLGSVSPDIFCYLNRKQ